ncbi:Fungal-type protein kinase domain-containing protein [Pleurotus pulmonarius]
MCKEMTGFWVGPCEVHKFFELTMPIGTETQEKLPDISTKFFSGLKPTKEKDLYPRLIKFCGKDNPNFPEIKLVDTSAHPDPDSKDGAKVKQDVTAYDNNLTIDENSPTRLGDAQFGVEVKDSLIELFYDGGKPKFETMDDAPFETNTDIGKKTRGQLVTYAVEICARQHRTHLFFVYIYFPFARFIRFDRSGALVSKRFDFTKDCTPLVRFFHRFSKMTPAERGYDPTVRVASKEEYAYARALLNDWAPKHERPVLKMDVHDSNTNQIRQFLVWGSLADPESPLGRATRGYPTVEVTNGLLPGAEPMFLKEQWRSTALGQEVDTLRELNKEGVPYVPTLVCGGDLPGQTTRTQDYATEIERKGDKRLDCRLHVRFVVSEVGFPIERFSSSKQLFQVLYHAFQAHKVAYTKCQLLHRDISGGNILIQSNGKGLLNDWDMAVKEEDLQNGPRAHERTGTWAFMSIAMLQATGRRHSVSDDLESFFWVALYYSLVYLPHNKLAKLPKIIKTIFEQYEEGDAEDEEATGGKGKRNVVHFGDEIGLGAKQPLEFTQSAPITHFVADMLKLLGERLKRLPTIGEDPEEDTKVEAMYRDVESIWAATLSSSSWPQSDRGKSQLLKKRGTPDDSQEDDSEERKSKKVKTWHI